MDTATARDWVPGTAGDDVLTVHKIRDDEPVCGAGGDVDEWRRRVNCPVCLTSE
jgi:hypothetical protein